MKFITFNAHNTSLKEIINTLDSFLDRYIWSMHDYDGILRENNIFDVRELCDKTTEFDTGYEISWAHLKSLAELSLETDDILLVGTTDRNKVPHVSKNNWQEKCEVIIDLFDSTRWEISVKNFELYKKLMELKKHKN